MLYTAAVTDSIQTLSYASADLPLCTVAIAAQSSPDLTVERKEQVSCPVWDRWGVRS